MGLGHWSREVNHGPIRAQVRQCGTKTRRRIFGKSGESWNQTRTNRRKIGGNIKRIIFLKYEFKQGFHNGQLNKRSGAENSSFRFFGGEFRNRHQQSLEKSARRKTGGSPVSQYRRFRQAGGHGQPVFEERRFCFGGRQIADQKLGSSRRDKKNQDGNSGGKR